jgi:DNA repair exonuclease SbcCD ATPase subunit
MGLSDLQRAADRLLADLGRAKATLQDEQDNLRHAIKQLKRMVKGQKIVQDVAQSIQTIVHQRIAEVVTKCLAAVFDEPYQFHIDFVRKRGKTEAELYFTREGMRVDPNDAAGGGVGDVAAFGLRLICLILMQPRRRLLIILDEPFKHLGAEHHGRCKSMMLNLSKELNFQFLIVTHEEGLMAGKIVRMSDS